MAWKDFSILILTQLVTILIISNGNIKGHPSHSQQAHEFNLWDWYQNYDEGPGVVKGRHYFEIYEKHFSKFRNSSVSILEIGIKNGGSLRMWREYFGPQATIFGLDINPDTKVYEQNEAYRTPVKVLIGSQSDKQLLDAFKNEVGQVDIIIDDGSHIGEDMVVTFDSLWPMIKKGGVYLAEDIMGGDHKFTKHLFAKFINAEASGINSGIRSQIARETKLHFYPYVSIVERRMVPLDPINGLEVIKGGSLFPIVGDK